MWNSREGVPGSHSLHQQFIPSTAVKVRGLAMTCWCVLRTNNTVELQGRHESTTLTHFLSAGPRTIFCLMLHHSLSASLAGWQDPDL